jgi:hypothetical protein
VLNRSISDDCISDVITPRVLDLEAEFVHNVINECSLCDDTHNWVKPIVPERAATNKSE